MNLLVWFMIYQFPPAMLLKIHSCNLTFLWNVSLIYFCLIFYLFMISDLNLFLISCFFFSLDCFYFLLPKVRVQCLFDGYPLILHHHQLALVIMLFQALFYLLFLVGDFRSRKVFDLKQGNNLLEFHLIWFVLHVLFVFIILISFFLSFIYQDLYLILISKINLNIYRFILLTSVNAKNFFLN